jgi:hypothetical protein
MMAFGGEPPPVSLLVQGASLRFSDTLNDGVIFRVSYRPGIPLDRINVS